MRLLGNLRDSGRARDARLRGVPVAFKRKRHRLYHLKFVFDDKNLHQDYPHISIRHK